MKPIIVTVVMFIASINLGSFEHTSAKNSHLTRGDHWAQTNEADQLWYLKGLYDGAHLSKERPNYKQWLPKVTLGQMRTFLERFYKNPENRDLPVPHALMLIHMEQTGEPENKIEGFKVVVREFLKRKNAEHLD